MAIETVQIADVKNKGNGWYDITLEQDERVLSTKDTRLAEIATASVGASAEVEINTRTKGSFTNHYLQTINGEKESGRPTRSAPRSAPAPTGGRDTATQERIARQWAMGRAVELLVSSDASYGFPVDDETFALLCEQASKLLDATKGD